VPASNHRLKLTARLFLAERPPQLCRSVRQTSGMIEHIDNMHIRAYDIADGLRVGPQ
jgi:hypothetical protein